MAADLKGWAVLVTRPEPEARGLASLVLASNGVPIVQPAVTLEAFDDPESLKRLARLADYDGVILTSTNALRFALDRMSRDRWPEELRLFAVGETTRRRAGLAGFQGVIGPGRGVGSEGLLAVLSELNDPPRRLLMLAAPGGRTLLVETLAQRGIQVDLCHVYQRRAAERIDANVQRLRGLWNRLLVIATSGFILKSVTAMFDGLEQRPLVVPSPRVRELARELGYRQVVVASRPDDAALVEAATRFVTR